MKTFTNTLDIYIAKGRKEGIQKGFERGEKKAKWKFVKNLITTNKFTPSEIAGLADVNVSFVKKVQTELKQKE